MTPTVGQIRAARALLGWSQVRLAEAAGVSEPTVKRFEGGRPVSVGTRDVLQSALEAAGVEFTNGAAPGVRLIKAP